MFNVESNRATNSPPKVESPNEVPSNSKDDFDSSCRESASFEIEQSQGLPNGVQGSEQNNGRCKNGQNSLSTVKSVLKRSKLITQYKFDVDSDISGMELSADNS